MLLKNHHQKKAIDRAADEFGLRAEQLIRTKSDTTAYLELFSDVNTWVGTGNLDSIDRFKMETDSTDPHIALRDASIIMGRLILDTEGNDRKKRMLNTLADLIRQKVERVIEIDGTSIDWAAESNGFIQNYLVRLKTK